MHGKISTAVLLALCFSPVIGAGIPATDQPAEPDTFFHEFIALKDDQITEIRGGKGRKDPGFADRGQGVCFRLCLHQFDPRALP